MITAQNGLKSIWRSKAKSILLFLLLCALTAILALGLCIYHAVDDYLAQCDDSYTTIAELEYIGTSYPDKNVYDEELAALLESKQLDTQALSRLDGVISWEPSTTTLGVVPGMHRTDSLVYDGDAAVLTIGKMHWDEHCQAYCGIVLGTIYSRKDRTGLLAYIPPEGFSGLSQPDALDVTQQYVVCGRYFDGPSGYTWYLPEKMDIEIDGKMVTLSGYEVITDNTVPDDSPYRVAAELMSVHNNGMRVQTVKNLQEFRPFQQEELSLEDGRFYTAQEKNVCVISDRAADYLSVKVGDSLDLSINHYDNGIFQSMQTELAPTTQYTIIGIYIATDNYPDWVFVPDVEASGTPNGYQVGQFVLKNDKAEAFYTQVTALLPAGCRIAVYDQGYTITAAPYQELLKIAQLFLAVCAMLVLAVLALYGYLFVYRQREGAQTMRMMGCGRGKICSYFASGAAVICALGGALGIVVSFRLERFVLEQVAAFAAHYQKPDLRFSSGALSVTHSLEFAPKTPLWVYFLAAALLLAGVLLACVLFTLLILKKKKPKKKKKQRVPKDVRTSTRMSGWLTYGALSVRRGVLRTLTVLLFAVVVTGFLGQLTATSDTYKEQLASIKESTTVRGYISNSTGLDMNRQVIKTKSVQALSDSGLLSSLDISRTVSHYRYIGVVQHKDGSYNSINYPILPTTGFSLETLAGQMVLDPRCVATTSLTNSPEFYYYVDALPVTWLDGYDESCLRGTQPDLCVLPTAMMERESIELGDFISIQVFEEDWRGFVFYFRDLYVVGTYELQGTQETIYVPFDYDFPTGQRAETPEMPEYLHPRDCNGIRHGVHGVSLALESKSAKAFLDTYVNASNDKGLNITLNSVDISDMTGRNNYVMISDELYKQWDAQLDFNEQIKWYGNVWVTPEMDDGLGRSFVLIGSFEKTSEDMADMYFSPSCYDWTEVQELQTDFRGDSRLTLESTIFTLRDNDDLDMLRDTLEQAGFTSPPSIGKVRSWAVVDDKQFTGTVRSLERQIQYLDTLYRFLYVLTGVISLVVAYLMVGTRKPELSTLRSFGMQKRYAFGNFFIEQLVLVLAGVGAGMGLWLLFGGASKPLWLWLLLAFTLCWLVGTAINLLRLTCSKKLTVLSEPE